MARMMLVPLVPPQCQHVPQGLLAKRREHRRLSRQLTEEGRKLRLYKCSSVCAEGVRFYHAQAQAFECDKPVFDISN